MRRVDSALRLGFMAVAGRGIGMRDGRGMLPHLARIVRAREHGCRSDSLERDRQQHQPHQHSTDKDDILHAAILACARHDVAILRGGKGAASMLVDAVRAIARRGAMLGRLFQNATGD